MNHAGQGEQAVFVFGRTKQIWEGARSAKGKRKERL